MPEDGDTVEAPGALSCSSSGWSRDVAKLEERDCPVCGSPRRTGALSTQGAYELVRCHVCGMLYTHAVLAAEAKAEQYAALAAQRRDTTASLMPAHYGLANQIRALRLYETVLAYVVRAFPAGDVNLIDVGCAGGLLLSAAQVIEDSYNCDRPPRFAVRGISFDPRERAETERNVGCRVAGVEEARARWAGWADVVTAMNVLEHVNEPISLLSSLKDVLRANGLLIVDVPNNVFVALKGSILRRWPTLDLGEHINHFVPRTLDRLFWRAGFTPVCRLPGLLHGVESFGKRPPWRSVARWLAARALFVVSLGSIQVFPHMTVVYRNGS